LDFQRPQSSSLNAEVDGSIWGAPVVAPASGYVDRIKNDVTDNPLGISNYAENWGNYVVIRLDQGYWALLAHLQQWTIAVKPGERVEIGTYLGAAGNSGRSPVPHLHFQVQNLPELGAATVPFRLANYNTTSHPEQPFLHWNAASLPPAGAVLSGASVNGGVHAVLSSIAPGQAIWTLEIKGHIPRPFRVRRSSITSKITNSIDEAGQHILDAGPGGSLVCGLAPDAWRVIEGRRVRSPLLRSLALAISTIPYAATVGMTWQDPAPLVPPGASWLRLLLAPYIKRPFTYVRSTCVSEPGTGNEKFTIETRLEPQQRSMPTTLVCQMDRLRGPVRLEVIFKNGTCVYSLLSFQPGLSPGAKEGE
jgi:hypothetical protein